MWKTFHDMEGQMNIHDFPAHIITLLMGHTARKLRWIDPPKSPFADSQIDWNCEVVASAIPSFRTNER